MSHYSKVLPGFWTGDTGRALRGDPAAQVVAAYLLTSPHANMIGFYYLPLSYVATDTGLPFEGASEALRRLCEGGFCHYDESSEVVWVVEMAKFQVGESLEAKDNRCASIRREYASLPNNRLLQDFFDRYGQAYHMNAARGFKAPPQAPSKPTAVTAAVAATAPTSTPAAQQPSAAARRPSKSKGEATPITNAVWVAYAGAYRQRYGADPVRNRKVNGMLADFLDRVPMAEAPEIAAFYVGSEKGLYRSARHCVDLLLRDAEGLRTEWFTGRRVTEAEARQADQTSARVEQVHRLTREKAA